MTATHTDAALRAVDVTAHPIVSVIIPTYNRLPLLREAVDSVLAQTFTDWELVIVDDGSTDDTRAYLEDLAIRDRRIRPVFMDHAGSMTVMRTAGIAAMRGEWIALLDSDDLWAPNKLAVQLGWLGEHPECGWSFTGYHHVDATGHRRQEETSTLQRPQSGWIFEQLVTFKVAASPPTLMVRRSLFEDVGGFDQTLHLRSDYDLILRLAARSEACGVAEDLVMAREHSERTSKAFPALEHLKENELMFGKACAYAPEVRLRRLCAEQRAIQWLGIARIHAIEGQRSPAWREIVRAVTLVPTSSRIWRGVVSHTVRQLLPIQKLFRVPRRF